MAGSNIQSAQLPGRCEIRGREGSVRKDEAQEEDMWAEDEGGIKDDLRKGEFVPSVCVSSASNRRRTKGARGGEESRRKTYASFTPRNCFVNSHVNSIKIRCGPPFGSRSRVTMMSWYR